MDKLVWIWLVMLCACASDGGAGESGEPSEADEARQERFTDLRTELGREPEPCESAAAMVDWWDSYLGEGLAVHYDRSLEPTFLAACEMYLSPSEALCIATENDFRALDCCILGTPLAVRDLTQEDCSAIRAD